MFRSWPFGLIVLLAAVRSASAAPLPVFVSIPPQAVFVQSVGGSRVAISVLVPPGANHETYEPTPRQLQGISTARIYFRVGLPFEEAWLPRLTANAPGLTVVDTRRGVPLLVGHDHGPSPGQAHAEGVDPHIWLDPVRVKVQARTIRDALAAADPDHRAEYDRNLTRFEAELTALDAELRDILARARQRRFLIYHPAWGYFAQAYGLEQIAIERDGKEPGPRSLAEFIDTARRSGLRTILVQAHSSDTTARRVAQALGGRVAPVDALPEDYFGTLRAVARLIAEDRP